MEADDSIKLDEDMKLRYCSLEDRLSILIPEIMPLIDSNITSSLDKWFKNYYPNTKSLTEIIMATKSTEL